jgi:hypothetical protein
MEGYLKSIKNLSGGSRDCYFYYVVPDEMKQQVAEYFNDVLWLNFIKLNTFRERLEYRRVMCRFDNDNKSDDDDDQDQMPPPYDKECESKADSDDDDMLDKYLDPRVPTLWKERLLIVLLMVLILKLTFNFF